MFARRNPGYFAALLVLSVVIVVAPSRETARATPPPKPTPPPAKLAPLACEVTPDVKLGDKATIKCTGFSRNGNVNVVFNRPDGTTSDHVGRADDEGAFDGTFTVDPDRPAGTWTLELTDAASGRKIAIPFTVTAPPVTSPTASASPPPPAPPPAPAPTRDASRLVAMMDLLPWWVWVFIAFAIFGLTFAALLFLLRLKRSRAGQAGAPLTPPPTQADSFPQPQEPDPPPPTDQPDPSKDRFPHTVRRRVAEPPPPVEQPDPSKDRFPHTVRRRVADPPPVEPPPPAHEAPEAQPPPPQQCGAFERRLIRTVEGQWRHQSSRTVSIPPSSDPATIVVWAKTIYNEFAMFGECPLSAGHGGDHEGPLVPESNEREAVRTITQEESYPFSARRPKPPRGLGLPEVRD